MQGKVLKVFNNDLYGKSDEREVLMYAAFVHKKYMNKYAIFTFNGECDKKKLCFGSIHVKDNSLVIFNIKENVNSIIDDLLNQIETNNYDSSYEIIDLSNVSKVELVGYNEKEYDKLLLLEELTIPKSKIEDVVPQEKHSLFKIILLLLLIPLGIFVYWYICHDDFNIESLECIKNDYHGETKLNYQTYKVITFDDDKKIKSISATETYNFKSLSFYQKFKDEERNYEYFSYGDSFEYNDQELKLNIYYQEQTVINDYEKIKYALENDGYSCKEVLKDE